jgi:hypothetical protein
VHADAASVINDLLSLAQVQRVVSIDDMNASAVPVEDALALIPALPTEDISEIFSDYPGISATDELDIRRREIRRVWENETDEKRRLLLNRLRARRAERQTGAKPENQTEAIDEHTFIELVGLFAKHGIELFSLSQWRERYDEIVSGEMLRTLFLIDEDFSKEQEGLRFSGIDLIKNVIKDAPAQSVLCALLTHNPRYQPETLHASWKQLCNEHNLDPGKFVLIPKKLIYEDPIGFARLVKLALLNGKVDALKRIAHKILTAAQDEAYTRLNDIDIYDFDQIVFRSSWKEGVWEPDTLFRVFGLFHRDETRKLAKKDDTLFAAADSIRAISLVPTKSKTAPNYNTIALQRLELYESGEFLNMHFMPIDVGDIFQKIGDSSKRFILLAQPCDLMVRPDGKRNPFINEALLAEIVRGPIKDRDGHSELLFLEEEPGAQYYVSFKRTHTIKLSILDMCALNPSGDASLDLESPSHERVIPAWKLHYHKLAKEFAKIVRQTETLTKQGTLLKTAGELVARSSNSEFLLPTIDVDHKTISFNLKRVARLRQPRASALFSRFANFIARQAFDHDFVDPDEKTEPQNSGAADDNSSKSNDTPQPETDR